MKTGNQYNRILMSAFVFSFFLPLAAQDGFGFDAETEAGTIASSSVGGVSIGGEASASILQFTDGVNDFDSFSNLKAGNFFSGRLDFTATGSNADAVIKLEIPAIAEGVSPVAIDEVYVRAYFGKADLEGGLRKLTWGKADSQGPLDILNPRNLTDLTVTDSMRQKIARPMLHLTYALGSFTKLEGVLIPSFQGHNIAVEGRWAPAQIKEMTDGITAAANATADFLVANTPMKPEEAAVKLASLESLDYSSLYPDTSTLEYSQAGLRFTTTLGSSDVGFQYFYGNLPKPAITIDAATLFTPTLDFNPDAVTITYNRYHQIGVDWAAVLPLNFNTRAELAANITEDFTGDDGAVYNPALLWSLGFDRDLVAGINLNAQGTGSVRLMDGEVGDTVEDIESASDVTSTKITVQLSKKFLREEFELKVAGIYGIEDEDFLFMPTFVWTKGDLVTELTAGIFGGAKDGELGQYADNTYLKASLTYKF